MPQLKMDFKDETISFSPIHVSKSTFLNGLDSNFHRWFRLTPSFGPKLVEEMLYTLECEKDEVVLDPFAGAGTTLIECKLRGFESYGFEINPFLHFVGQVSLNWELDEKTLLSLFNDIEKEYFEKKEQIKFENLSEFNLEIPPIYNPTRWWREDVLANLLWLKRVIYKITNEKKYKDFFILALAGVLVPDLTNVTLSKLQLHFIDRSEDKIEVWATFKNQFEEMIEDLQSVGFSDANYPNSRNIHCDAANSRKNGLRNKIDCVITSPPYPNRYSYVWNTRPHLYLFDYFNNSKQASSLDKKTIGGTWGSATSDLGKKNIKPNNLIVDIIGELTKNIKKDDLIMGNYVVKYFNLLTEQIIDQESLLTDGARVAYVVGCSRIKGHYIETDVILGDILGKFGFDVFDIHRFRRRNSGKNLFESIVYGRKKKFT